MIPLVVSTVQIQWAVTPGELGGAEVEVEVEAEVEVGVEVEAVAQQEVE
jgi:hypothetical protein